MSIYTSGVKIYRMGPVAINEFNNLSAQVLNVDIGVLPLNMGTSRKERMGK
jgi:hypothetical protein